MAPACFADELTTQLIRAQHDSGGSADGMQQANTTATSTGTANSVNARMPPSQGPSATSQATTLAASTAEPDESFKGKGAVSTILEKDSVPVSPGPVGQTGYFTQTAPDVTSPSATKTFASITAHGDYLTKSAPYLSFLDSAAKVPDSSHVYPAAFRPLLEKLRQDAKTLRPELQSSIATDRAPDHIMARVLDIKMDNDVRVTHDMLDQALGDPRERLSAAGELTQVLQTSSPDLHTRLLLLCMPKEQTPDVRVLKDARKRPKSDMAELRRSMFSMMLAHILGVVLDQDVDSVAGLGVGSSKYDDKQRAFCSPQRQGVIKCSDGLCRLTWVGPRGEGENQHLLGIVLFTETLEYMSPKLELRPSQIHQGALLSLQMQQAVSSGIIAVYTRFLKHANWSSQTSEKLKPRTHWLDAIIRMELHRCHTESAHVHHAGYTPDTGTSPQSQLRKWHKITTRMSTTTDRLTDYVKIAVLENASDMAGAKQVVEAFLAEMHRNTESLRAEAEELKERWANQMAESAHRLAKRGLLLTCLAAAYLPLSLATSVFGMNVQEVNGTGHWLWVVIVAAVLMLIATALFWYFIKTGRQAIANAAHMRAFIESEQHDGLPVEALLAKHSQSMKYGGKPVSKWYHGWRRMSIMAGFKPLEEVDPALVGVAKRRLSEQRISIMV